jgi:hypothetical protein
MNKINLSFILKSIIIVAITATEQCQGTQCEQPTHSCGTKIKVLDQSLGIGTVTCTERGVTRKACQHIHKYNFECILTPLEKQEVGLCYHMTCSWETHESARIVWSIPGPDYTVLHIDMYPQLDIHPLLEILLLVIIVSIMACLVCSIGDGSTLAAGVLVSSMMHSGESGYRSSSSSSIG